MKILPSIKKWRNSFRNILGGYSGIYLAWALSKTGGKLITIDIDEKRHMTAVIEDVLLLPI